jgi:hypothetical protein
MAQYYRDRVALARPQQPTIRNRTDEGADAPVLSDFDKHRQTLLTNDAEEGWAPELRRYLSTMQRDVTKDTDLVEWWQVGCLLSFVKTTLLI